MSEAWVTLATNDSYAIGALVLASSLKRVCTTKKLHCLTTSGVSHSMREQLTRIFDTVDVVDVLDSKDTENLALIERPDLGVTFTKLHCWRLTQYSKCVFLDADTMLLKNSDELFSERDEFSAAPDIGWPDMFNSGVFVFVPNVDTYRALQQCALKHGSFDGGDQGLLNTFFAGWRDWDSKHRLPFIYNMSSSAVYSYAAAYKQYGPSVKIVHFLGAVKPWHYSYNAAAETVSAPGTPDMSPKSIYASSHLLLWWHLFVHDVQPTLPNEYWPLHAPIALRPDLSRFYSLSRPVVTDLRSLLTDLHGDWLEPSYPPAHFDEKPATAQPSPDDCPDDRTVSEQELDTTSESYEYDHHEHEHHHEPEQEPICEHESSTEQQQQQQPEQPIVKHHEPYCYMDRQPETSASTQPTATAPAPAISHRPLERVFRVRYRGDRESHTTTAQPLSDIPENSPQSQRRAPPKPRKSALKKKRNVANPDANVRLDENNEVLTGGVHGTPPPLAETFAGTQLSEVEHQRAWEAGVIDYRGRDSWENIQRRLDAALAAPPRSKLATGTGAKK